jgi:hypothetical protein
MADDIKYERRPELFDYNQPRIEEYHSPRYSNTDKGLLALYEAINAMDWTQTLQGSRHPEKYNEERFPTGSANIIGRHPSRDSVNALMGGQSLAVPLIYDKVPENWRKVLLGLLIAAKGSAVKNNQSIGLDAYRW